MEKLFEMQAKLLGFPMPFYCDAEADHDNDPNKLGCHGRGACTVLNMDTALKSSMFLQQRRSKIEGKW